MAKTKVIDGMLYFYEEKTGKWHPKFKTEKGVRWELDEKYLVYVLERDSIDESIRRNEELDATEPYNLSYYYGQARQRYLEENFPMEVARMRFNYTYLSHLIQVDKEARELEDRLIEEGKKAEGITEQLKMSDMMEWVGRMNNLIHRVREYVQHECVYQDI